MERVDGVRQGDSWWQRNGLGDIHIALVGVIVVAGVASEDCWMAVVASVYLSIAVMVMVATASMEEHLMIVFGGWPGPLLVGGR